MTVRLSQHEFVQLRDLIRRVSGIDLRDSKLQLLEKRLQPRLMDLQLKSYGEYYAYLERQGADGAELVEMLNCVSTNKTDFFREPHHFQFLGDRLFPSLIADAHAAGPNAKKHLRIWSAACSTGEETYSLAMTVRDAFADEEHWDLRILGSDIDTTVLARAEAGIYDQQRVEHLPRHLVHRHFRRGRDSYAGSVRVKPELREITTFRRINFADASWPVRTRFDVIFCRNAMIYFDQETQDRLLRSFWNFLNPSGYLFLGHSEGVIRESGWFRPLGKTIFQRLDQQSPEPPPARSFSLAPQTPTNPPTSRSDESENASRHSIIVGEVFASDKPVWISTLLGSCISACLYDEQAGVGGMNHFLLPLGTDERSAATYGIHAMELLINQIMQLGGDRRRLKAKIFGGANVLKSVTAADNTGERNTRFVREFLDLESIPVVAELIGGNAAVQVQFFSQTGRALARRVEAPTSAIEQLAPSSPPVDSIDDDDSVTLF